MAVEFISAKTIMIRSWQDGFREEVALDWYSRH